MGVWTHQWTTLRNLVQLLVRMDSWESAAVLSGAVSAHGAAAQGFGADAERMHLATEQLAERLGPSRWSAAAAPGCHRCPATRPSPSRARPSIEPPPSSCRKMHNAFERWRSP